MELDDSINEAKVLKRTEKIVAVLPWGIVGALVVLGAITVVFAGLPFQTKTEAAMQERMMTDRLITLAEAQKDVANSMKTLTIAVTSLSAAVAVLQEQVSSDRHRLDELQNNGIKHQR